MNLLDMMSIMHLLPLSFRVLLPMPLELACCSASFPCLFILTPTPSGIAQKWRKVPLWPLCPQKVSFSVCHSFIPLQKPSYVSHSSHSFVSPQGPFFPLFLFTLHTFLLGGGSITASPVGRRGGSLDARAQKNAFCRVPLCNMDEGRKG